MSNPEYPGGIGEVDPSEGAIDEGGEQSLMAADAEGEQSAMLEVDPSEGPTE